MGVGLALISPLSGKNGTKCEGGLVQLDVDFVLFAEKEFEVKVRNPQGRDEFIF